MSRPPTLVEDGETVSLDVAVRGGRRTLRVSTRAESLLVDDLGYDHADLVPFDIVKALVLAGGATLPDGTDPIKTAWRLSAPDGGRATTSEDAYRTAEYLRAVDIADGAVPMLREHVADTALARYVTPAEIQSNADRVGDLSDIARNL